MREYSPKVTAKLIEVAPQFTKERIANALLRNHEEKLQQGLLSNDSNIRANVNWYKWNRKLREDDPKGVMGVQERVWYLLNGNESQRKQWRELKGEVGSMDNFGATLDDQKLQESMIAHVQGEDDIDSFVMDHLNYSGYREALFAAFKKAITKNPTQWKSDVDLARRVKIASEISSYRSQYSSGEADKRIKKVFRKDIKDTNRSS